MKIWLSDRKLILVNQVCAIFIIDSFHSAMQMYYSYITLVVKDLGKNQCVFDAERSITWPRIVYDTLAWCEFILVWSRAESHHAMPAVMTGKQVEFRRG